MQFQVPQFIEIEDKIIGPLSLKQFIYMSIAAFVVFLLFFVLQTWLWIIIATVVASFSAAFAFIKYNGRPFIHILLAGLAYIWRPKFYVWRHSATTNTPVLPSSLSVAKNAPQKQKNLKHLWLEMNTSKQVIESREKKFSALDYFKRPAELVEQFEVHKKQTGDQEISRRIDYR